METKKIIYAGFAGAVTLFLLGWLTYGMLLMDFFHSHAGSATGVEKGPEEMMIPFIFLGNLATGFLYAIILGKWANITTAGGGLKAGAIIGFLSGAGMDFIMYGTSNIMTMTGMCADLINFTVMSAIAGAVIGSVLGMGKK